MSYKHHIQNPGAETARRAAAPHAPLAARWLAAAPRRAAARRLAAARSLAPAWQSVARRWHLAWQAVARLAARRWRLAFHWLAALVLLTAAAAAPVSFHAHANPLAADPQPAQAPGTVTLGGRVTYTGRDGTPGLPGAFLTARLWEADGPALTLLDETTTAADGSFAFRPMSNIEDDGSRLDLRVTYHTVFHPGQPDAQQVTDLKDNVYQWVTTTSLEDVPDGPILLDDILPSQDPTGRALWLFADLMRAYHFMPSSPGPAHIHWQPGTSCIPIAPLTKPVCAAFMLPKLAVDGIFIPDAPHFIDAPDQVVHEVGHAYMTNQNGFWFSTLSNLGDLPGCAFQEHVFFDRTNATCAWTEGFAEFLAVAVNQSLNPLDVCYDFDASHCGRFGTNFEVPSAGDGYALGDEVELRIAASLWDLYDTTPDGFDAASYPMAAIWNAVRKMPSDFTFRAFWDSWLANGPSDALNFRQASALALYQNTVAYDPETAFLPVTAPR